MKNEMKEKFEQLVNSGDHLQALAIFHDHGDESYVRFLLEHIAMMDKLIGDLEYHKKCSLNVDFIKPLNIIYATSPPKPRDGTIYFNTASKCFYRFDGVGEWIEYVPEYNFEWSAHE